MPPPAPACGDRPQPRESRVGSIDALRGVAILMVILVHVGQNVPRDSLFASWTPFGQYGVQLFFVLSAYSLCLSFARRPGGNDGYAAFMIKRYWRIAPMYYVALVFFFAVTWGLERRWPAGRFYTPTADYTSARVLANVLLAHSFVPSANNSIVPGGWSIATEFLFYAFFPFFLRLARWRPLLLVAVPAAALGVLALVLAWFSPSPGFGSGFAYCSLPNQLPCFAAGIALHLLRDSRLFTRALLAVGPLALFGLIKLHWLPWGWRVTPILCALAFGALVLGLGRLRLRDRGVLVHIGQCSYSIYCLHYFFVGLAVRPLARIAAGAGWNHTAIALAAFAFVAAAATLAASFTYRRIELPFIARGKRIAGRLGP